MGDKVKVLAWHGDPQLKADTVAAMIEHRALDQIARGNYLQFFPGEAAAFKGCFHGCLLVNDLAAERGLTPAQFADKAWGMAISVDWHEETEKHFGIPTDLGDLLDFLFETRYDSDAGGQFAVDALEAMQPGADLSMVSWQVAEELLVSTLAGYGPLDAGLVPITEHVLELVRRHLAGHGVNYDQWVEATEEADRVGADTAAELAHIAAGVSNWGGMSQLSNDEVDAMAVRVLRFMAEAPVPA